MSNTILVTLMAAVAMIVVAVYLELTFVAGGSGVVFVVGLSYAYVVARRELALLSFAVEAQDGGDLQDSPR